jgi:hypothetical protein
MDEGLLHRWDKLCSQLRMASSDTAALAPWGDAEDSRLSSGTAASELLSLSVPMTRS